MELQRITRAVARPPSAVELEFDDGAVMTVELGPLIERGGVYAALADPAVFREVRIGDRGRFIEWPGEIDFCADALRMQGKDRERLAS